MTLKGGSTYWLMVDGRPIDKKRFITKKLTEKQIDNVINRECEQRMISSDGVELIRATTKWDYKVNDIQA